MIHDMFDPNYRLASSSSRRCAEAHVQMLGDGSWVLFKLNFESPVASFLLIREMSACGKITTA